MNFENVKKSINSFFVGVVGLLLVISLMGNFLLMNRVQNDQRVFAVLSAQTVADKAQIQKLLVDLETSKAQTKMIEAKLQTAIIPQDNFKDAFSENIGKPVADTARAAWSTVSESTKQAFAYFSR